MRLRTLILLIFLMLICCHPVLANKYTVQNTNDSGAGSLREAILQANGHVGWDTLLFDMGAPGIKTITTLNVLPNITDTLYIDGSSDPAYTGTPVIEVNGNTHAIVFRIVATAPYSHVHALTINNTTSMAVRIGADHCKITSSYIGTNAAGTAAANNDFTGIGIYSAHHIVLGGTGPNEGNLVSGSRGSGIFMYQSDTALIIGNKIGTDITGSYAIPNANGIALNNTNFVQIGGGTAAHRNLISGNTHGIYFSTDSDRNIVCGNYIGTDNSGLAAIANNSGVFVRGDSNKIGGILLGQGNLISGNTQEGIEIAGDLTGGFYPRGNTVQGNLIGTDITGAWGIANGYGININHGCEGTIIGGNTLAARNIISGNTKDGIRMHIADSTQIYGNIIGLDISGSLALGNQRNGIDVSWSSKTFIGNANVNEANIIGSNTGHGIYIHYVSDSNYVHQNYIGTDLTGLLNLANTRNGIQVGDRSTYTEVGGYLAGEGNIIANNLAGGVEINGNTSINNRILGNSIYDHPLEGIRLSNGNNLQTAPALTGYTTGPTSTISGTFTSLPNTTYRIEFFTSNTSVQGKTFIGTANITTDATGFYAVNETLPVTITAAEPIITATATDPNGNTSPFGVETVLAAEITAFSVQELENQAALLSWEIPQNQESFYFDIEHQPEGQGFQKIGEQHLYATHGQQRSYEFVLNYISPGIHYFRLLKVGLSGSATYSETRMLQVGHQSPFTLLFENPLKSNSSMSLSLEETQKVDIYLLNIQGSKVATIYSGRVEGGSSKTLRLSSLQSLSAGIYTLTVKGNYFQTNKKIWIK